MSVERNPKNRMLGRREVVDGMVSHLINNATRHGFLISILLTLLSFFPFLMQPGEYVWLTYEEVYDIVLKVGASIRSCGVEKVRFYFFKKLSLIFFVCFVFNC